MKRFGSAGHYWSEHPGKLPLFNGATERIPAMNSGGNSSMSTTNPSPTPSPADCCPVLSDEICCDVLDFRYRLPHHVQLNDPAGRVTVVTVEVILHIRITRCPGPLFL